MSCGQVLCRKKSEKVADLKNRPMQNLSKNNLAAKLPSLSA